MSVSKWTIALASVLTLVSCADSRSVDRPFSIVFIVESDPGLPLEGVNVLVDGKSIGKTDANGSVRAEILAIPGARLQIEQQCPKGHQATEDAKSIRVRKFERLEEAAPRTIQVTLKCKPLQRLAVFIVTARNGPDLPVFIDGDNAGRTNQLGVAQISRWGVPGTEYAVEIDTRADPRLLPRSPVHVFTLPDAHEIFVVNESFQLQERRRSGHRRRARITKIE